MTWPLPLLNETRCVGCGVCVRLCPTDCLALAGPLPWLPRPGDCVSCGVCVVVCPVDALHLAGHAGPENAETHGTSVGFVEPSGDGGG